MLCQEAGVYTSRTVTVREYEYTEESYNQLMQESQGMTMGLSGFYTVSMDKKQTITVTEHIHSVIQGKTKAVLSFHVNDKKSQASQIDLEIVDIFNQTIFEKTKLDQAMYILEFVLTGEYKFVFSNSEVAYLNART